MKKLFIIPIVLLVGFLFFNINWEFRPKQDLGTSRRVYLPDPKITPGVLNPAVTQENLKTTVCVGGWSSKQRPSVSWTAPRERESIKQYGYEDTNPSNFEYDHRVPISLSGAPRDTANLWPQKLTGEYNALMKDRLEYRVYRDLCAGKVTLKQAQDIFLGDWTKAYDRLELTFGSMEEAIDPDDIE